MKDKSEIYVGKIVETGKFGFAKIVEVIDGKYVRVVFLSTGKHTHVFQRGHFLRGAIRDLYSPARYGVGYIGEGSYTRDWSKGVMQAHRIWTDMLRRCYDAKSHKNNPTYKVCTVSEEWHNFQNFADWYLNHESYGLGYDLDKDLLVRGNKTYSPEACCMIPPEINVAIQDGALSNRKLPRGVYKHTGKGYFSKIITEENGNLYERFTSPEEARIFYKKKKREDLKYRAEKWKYLVAVDVYESLKAWEV